MSYLYRRLWLSKDHVSPVFYLLVLLALLMPLRGNSIDTFADSLLKVVSAMADDVEKADQLIRLSRHYYRIDYDSALRYCSMAGVLSEKLEYDKGMADALYIKSLVFKNRSDLVKAQDYLDSFLAISTRIGDSIRLAKGYHQQGNLQEEYGNFDLSQLYYKKSLAVYLPLNDTHAIVANYNSIANYFKNKAEYDSATLYFMKAIDLTEKQNDDMKLSILYRNLGDNYLLALDLYAARMYFNRSQELCKKMPNREKEIGDNYNCLARVSVEEMKFDEALDFYNQAKEFFQKADYTRGLIDLDNNFGDLYFRQEDYDRAIRYFDKAIVKYRELGYMNEFVITLENKAAALTEKGNYSQAIILHDSCLKIATALDNKELRMDILRNIATLYESKGEYKRANEFYHLHYRLKDSIYNLSKAKVIHELMLKYEKEKDQARILLMEKENLEKDVALERRTRQRNTYLYSGGGVVLFLVFLFSYYNQRTRKNRVIAEQRIHQLEEEKKLLAARSLVEGQEEERKRIALELHDGLGVLLSSAKMHFTTIRDKSPESHAMIDKATKLLEQATGDVRRISHNMMPGLLTKYGFYEAVGDLIEQVDEMGEIHAELKIEGRETRLKENTEIMLYRIVQELVNNTLKHAKASNINLKITVHPEKLEIIYDDDGKGFDFTEKIRTKSIGLTSVLSRVKFLGGDLKFKSEEGKGFSCLCQVPL